MTEFVKVTGVEVNRNKLTINYDTSIGLKKYFSDPYESFSIEYTEDISIVPKGIAVIPFVCNILPMIWFTDAVLELIEIDKTFFESINEFKKGFVAMYPRCTFNGVVKAHNLVDYQYETNGGNAAFFSGGVDAFTTLIAHRYEKPVLMTLRGADIKMDDIEGWNIVYNHLQKTVKDFNLPKPICVTTNFRTFINEGTLHNLVFPTAGDGWWHGFQSGIGLIGHAAPLAYIRHFDWIYIASTFDLSQKNVTCSSHYTIDNHIRFASSRVLHDQVEHSRQGKIKIITDYCKSYGKYIDLRVCWISRGGRNCCHCEKCLRTMYGIFAEGELPIKYGFDYTEEDIKNSKNIIVNTMYDALQEDQYSWILIKNAFIESQAFKNDKRINWIYNFNPYAKRPAPSLYQRMRWKVGGFLRKIGLR